MVRGPRQPYPLFGDVRGNGVIRVRHLEKTEFNGGIMLKTFRTAWVIPALFFLVAGCSNGEADAAADNPCADNPCAANPCADNPCAANPCADDAMDGAEDAMDDAAEAVDGAMDDAADAVDGAMDDAADAANPCGG